MSQNYDMREDEEIRAWFGVKSMSSVDMLPVFHSVVSRISRVGSLGQRADILTSIGFESEFQVLDNVSVSNNYSSSYFQRYYMAYREEVADFADCVLNNEIPSSSIEGEKVGGLDWTRGDQIGRRIPYRFSSTKEQLILFHLAKLIDPGLVLRLKTSRRKGSLQ